MQMNDYQNRALRTAIYRDRAKSKREALLYTALGMASEAGEVAGKVKKLIRDGELDDKVAASEIGDVLWYVAMAAQELGYDLSEIAQMNLDKLGDRKVRGVLGGNGDDR